MEIYIILFSLAALVIDVSQTSTQEQWENSVQQFKDIENLLSESSSEDLIKENKRCTEVLKKLPVAIYGLVSLLKAEDIGKNEEIHLQAMVNSFNYMVARLDQLDVPITQRMIEWRRIDEDIPKMKIDIESVESALKTYVNAPQMISSMFESLFKEAYEENLDTSTTLLKNMILMRSSPIEKNVFDKAREYFDNDPPSMASFSGFLLRTLTRSLTEDYFYVAVSGNSESFDNLSNQWLAIIAKILERSARVDREIKDAWTFQYFSDIDSIGSSEEMKSVGTRVLSQKIFNHLQKKFRQRKWFVLVHKSTNDNDKDRYYDNCKDYVRNFGRNVVVVNSIDANQDYTKIVLSSIFKNIGSREGKFSPKAQLAKIFYEKFEETNCDQRRFVGAIESKAEPHVSAPDGHIAKRIVVATRHFHFSDKPYHLIAFG